MLTNPLWIFKGLLSKTLSSISFIEHSRVVAAADRIAST
jgi:hypothetical protein